MFDKVYMDTHIYHAFNRDDIASDTYGCDKVKMLIHENEACGYGALGRYKVRNCLFSYVSIGAAWWQRISLVCQTLNWYSSLSLWYSVASFSVRVPRLAKYWSFPSACSFPFPLLPDHSSLFSVSPVSLVDLYFSSFLGGRMESGYRWLYRHDPRLDCHRNTVARLGTMQT